jgi:hypothetical protein
LAQHFAKGDFAMRLQRSAITASLATAAILAWPTTASALKDLVIDVNCASGDRIARALDRPNVLDRRMIIVVNGTCTENVVIERDDVTLKAGTSGGGVTAADSSKPAVQVNGARRVAVEGLAVTGGLHGVQAIGGAAVAIRGAAIRNAVQNGVFAFNSSTATIDGSTIENHGNSGVAVVAASSATMTGSTVRGNSLYGVVAVRAGSVLLGNYDAAGTVCCGNLIENNVFDGVLLGDASGAHLYGNTIQGNGATNGRWGVLAVRESSIVLRGGNVVRANGSAVGGGGAFARHSTISTGPGDTPVIPSSNEFAGSASGIVATHNSLVDLRGGTSITGNTRTGVAVEVGSRVRTDGSLITGNGWQGIFAGRAAGVELIGAGNTVSGNGQWGLLCGDNESSYNGLTTGITGNTFGDVNCSGY